MIIVKIPKKGNLRFAIIGEKSVSCPKSPKSSPRSYWKRECKDLNKTWSDIKLLAQSRVRWRAGVVDELSPGRDQGN